MKMFFKWLLLFLLMAGFIGFFYFKGYAFFQLSVLQQYYEFLQEMLANHRLLMVMSYLFLYMTCVLLSLPLTAFITIAGGLLFGPIAICYVVLSATLGASFIFMVVRSTLGNYLKKKAHHWILKIKNNVSDNAFYYMLSLRLLPIIPFSLVNILAALLPISFRNYFFATLIGIIPINFIYVMLGNGLKDLFKHSLSFSVTSVLTPGIFLPLLLAALIVLMPVFFRKKFTS